MGVFEKLKNVFFEEEYVEVEEPVKKKPAKEQIAKKIELPEIRKKKEKKEIKEEPVEIVPEVEEEKELEISDRDIVKSNNNGFKFPMNFEEEDFKNEDYKEIKPEVKREHKVEQKREKVDAYKEQEEKPYTTNYQGLYEGSLDIKKKKEFKPTPIISPIYGVLDKNYTKDEIVTKKEIRISSSPKNVDLDSVRQKAYGDLASDITASMYEDVEEKDEKKGEDNLLYDLNEEDSPAVNKVTVGDAEEYYNDLGLEYNIDYKDTSKEKATGRRVKKEEPKEEKVTKKEKKVKEIETDDEETVVEDNLFDLIDSMYEDKE